MQAIKDIFHPWRKWMTTTIILRNYTMLTIQSNPVHQQVTSWTSEHRHWSLKQAFQSAHSKTNLGFGLIWDQFNSISWTEVWPTNAQRTHKRYMHNSTCDCLCTQSFRPLKRYEDLYIFYLNISHRFTRSAGSWTINIFFN